MQTQPYVFDEFFDSGKEESISPFLIPSSKKWAKHLSLKTATISALFLLSAFILSFYSFDISRLTLVFVYFFAGIPALIGTLEDLSHLEINIDVLMTVAAFLSIIIGSEMEGALLLVLFSFSGALEKMVSEKAKGTIQSLGKLCPTTAKVIASDGTIYERSIREIPIGSHLLIKAGETIPLDGIVLEGKSFVNLSHLTGESAPISKQLKDEVQAGSFNLDGTLTIKVTRISSDSTIARIIHLIHQAAEAKPKLERFFDRFSKMYATAIILLSCFFALILPFLLSIPFLGIEGSLYRALTFLITASPCALIIATPTAYLSAINACAKKGILLKGGFTLDALASCKIFAFDKTGTLTTGKLLCNGVTSFPLLKEDCCKETAISIAASLERGVLHPMAEAINNYAKEKTLPLLEIKDFKAIPGYGLEGMVENGGEKTEVFLGHFAFIKEKVSSKLLSAYPNLEEEIHKAGNLVTILLVKETLFVFHFNDELRSGISDLLTKFKNNFRVPLIMITGDHYKSAKNIAEKVNIDGFHADFRPDEKLEFISMLMNEKGKKIGLAMIGDGINDAPALARATVGISMGKIGSQTAVEASDIVFLSDDLSLLDWLMHRAKHTVAIIKQNLFFALGVILLTTTPALLGFIPLWIAILLHEGGTVLVGFNGLRLLKK